MLLLTEIAYSARNGLPTKAEEPFLHPFEDRNGQASADQGFSTAN